MHAWYINNYINNNFGDDNIASTIQLVEELSHQLEPSAGADPQCLVNNAQESCNDIRPTLQEMYFDLPMDILETNHSVTSENSEYQLSHLGRTTIHSNCVEANSVEVQAKSVVKTEDCQNGIEK